MRPEIGFTFANGLRSLVRQDPDIIMVGEIRDKETASLAINAALTGHLVLSTLHTNSASGAVARLLDMGIEPFLLVSTLRVIIGQRLVRKLSADKDKHDLTRDEQGQLEKIVDGGRGPARAQGREGDREGCDMEQDPVLFSERIDRGTFGLPGTCRHLRSSSRNADNKRTGHEKRDGR